MAKLIKKKSDLAAKRDRTIVTNVIGHVLYVVCGVLSIEFIFAYDSLLLVLALFLASFVGLCMIHFTRDTMGIEKAGVDGENKALKMLLSGLPNTYTCINNAVIWYESRHNELDLIVVGPTGIFIVEVKNTAGEVRGSYQSKVLQQEKKNETKEMRNPMKQVATHADILYRYLKANGVRAWVQGVVLFVNPKCYPEITDIPVNGIPAFAVSDGGEKKLMDYIMHQSRDHLSQEEITKICSLI